LENIFFVISYAFDVRIERVAEEDLVDLEDLLGPLMAIKVGAPEIPILVEQSLVSGSMAAEKPPSTCVV
jgi:hypothetical protein